MLKLSLDVDVLRVDSFVVQPEFLVQQPDPVTTTIPSSDTWSGCFTVGTDECCPPRPHRDTPRASPASPRDAGDARVRGRGDGDAAAQSDRRGADGEAGSEARVGRGAARAGKQPVAAR